LLGWEDQLRSGSFVGAAVLGAMLVQLGQAQETGHWNEIAQALSYDLPLPTAGHFAPALVLQCKEANMAVHVRGLKPLQAFPQPRLNIQIGKVSRAKHPDVIMFGDTEAALEFEIYTRELILSPSDNVLDELETGPTVAVTFDNQTRNYPAIPVALGKSFAGKCRAQFPAALGKSR
jgi:hypothetical protein